MRKFIAAALLLLGLMVPVSASSFQLGTGVFFESSGNVDGFDLCIWGLQLEPRINAFNEWLAIEVPLAMGFDEDIVEFSLRPGMLLSIPLGNTVRFDAGLGTDMQITLRTDGTWEVNDAPYTLTGEAFERMTLDYRAGVMFEMDDFAVEVSARIPTNGTFTDMDMDPDWDEGEVGTSILVDIS